MIPKDEIPKFQAHRGYWLDGCKQNSLESLARAKSLGYDMVEFDVQVSADGVPFLFHDRDVAIDGKLVSVQTLKWQDLEARVRVDSLSRVLQSSDTPGFLNIELKHPGFLSSKFEASVLETIRPHANNYQILFSSFSPLSLWRMRRLSSYSTLALLATDLVENGNPIFLRRQWFRDFLRPQYLNLHQHMLTDEFVAYALEAGYGLAAWTVNDLDRAQTLLKLGVHSIITDSLLPS